MSDFFENDNLAIKNYLRLIIGLFVYFEGGHTFSEILTVFEMDEVKAFINETLAMEGEPSVLSLQSLLLDDEEMIQLMKESLIETAKFSTILRTKEKIHAEIEERVQLVLN